MRVMIPQAIFTSNLQKIMCFLPAFLQVFPLHRSDDTPNLTVNDQIYIWDYWQNNPVKLQHLENYWLEVKILLTRTTLSLKRWDEKATLLMTLADLLSIYMSFPFDSWRESPIARTTSSSSSSENWSWIQVLQMD